ncbi:hypothetical protein H4R19_005297, partial [Coemansia spiralis]
QRKVHGCLYRPPSTHHHGRGRDICAPGWLCCRAGHPRRAAPHWRRLPRHVEHAGGPVCDKPSSPLAGPGLRL